ncbi:MAG: hypothetical protein H6662_13095 [Ardenticatenaceae bacterium]|nr:hypothetical protein [Anaerolineales bacterium]MCB8922515.1 hypothetical protein [Ardenticatenaceae bacterium]MCB8989984.1 hypothetical protein [Ardenticatenaceae bacterium]
MDDSPYYRLLGRLYAWTFWMRYRRFLGFSVRTWLILLSLGLIFFVAGQGWSLIITLLLIALALLLQAAFWASARAGYNKFVPDDSISLPSNEVLEPIPANQKVTVRATGVFSLTGREDFVLLRRPTEYWHVPLGEHILMVEQLPGSYLYQFFNGQTLQTVQNGWFIFGRQPRRALAVTFLVTFGPDYNDPSLLYFVGSGEGAALPKPRTIYLSFDNEADHRAVWHTLTHAARQARA